MASGQDSTGSNAQLQDFRDQILYMAVHDLRGPLTAMLNGIELTLQDDSPFDLAEKKRILRLCLDSGGSLMRQIDSLLGIAQIEQRALPLSPERVAIPDLIDASYTALANTFAERAVALTRSLPPDLPHIHADREIMRRVFINLLDNALRFTLPGTEVRVSAMQDDRFAQVCVTDNGPGIPQDQRAHVFEPYRTLGGIGSSGGRRGIGLGLTFCKLAIEAHRGTIHIEDADGGMSGAQFVVRLPIEPAPAS